MVRSPRPLPLTSSRQPESRSSDRAVLDRIRLGLSATEIIAQLPSLVDRPTNNKRKTVNCPRRFTDNGNEVTVDLHGCSVEDALYIVRRTVQEACRRGRSRVVVIHGKSRPDRLRTIRGELMRSLELGEYDEWVTDHLQSAGGGQSILYMPIGAASAPGRIYLSNVVRPGR